MSTLVEPFLVPATGEHRGVLVWRWGNPMSVLSSAPVGGGPGVAEWVLNIGVGSDYDRTDLSDHAGEVAAELGLRGAGVAMFTAVDLSRRERCISGGVAVDATVGISHPTWAAGTPATKTPAVGGTINLVVQLPVGLDPGAAVNAVITATEAKAQALAARGVAGTGTATDAVTIVWPAEAAAERFAGPRSPWGTRIADAVYQAVWTGAAPRA
ncbi:MAG: adenosylcobinamide amidohydrolase [bacterium]|nr:adenosylcobinamide amidohydrolase [bacterium]MDE0351681.1 adenosylcobinamide amidohydrolase [bacterium]